MDSTVFVALINPGMALIFSAAFLLLGHHQPRLTYIRLLAWSFVAIAAGFLLQYFVVLDILASKLVSNLMFLAGGVGLAVGGLGRYGRRPPLAATMAFAAIGFAGFGWYLYVEPDIAGRILVINFAFGAITLVMAFALRGLPNAQPIDRFLMAMIAFWGVSFFVRPLVVLHLEGNYTSYDNFHTSLYWITLTFSCSLFMLTFALTLITAIALDLMAELRRESLTDPLSGLLNRRGFQDGLSEALGRAARRKLPLSLVVCDLDHFKKVNDTHGHAAGDRVIIAFADCLRASIGPTCIAGRIGGEEFAVVVDGASLTTARLFAEGIRVAFAATPGLAVPGEARLSASFGVAEWRPDEHAVSLFARADSALYDAKQAGRDRVRTRLAPSDGQPARMEHPGHARA